MYRNTELVEEWDDAQEKCGAWYGAFTGPEANPSGQLECSPTFSAVFPKEKRTTEKNAEPSVMFLFNSCTDKFRTNHCT